jgi:pilus assembly protein Flp/PilA
MTVVFSRVTNDESAAAAIEYALIASLIGIVKIGSFSALGGDLGSTFNSVGGQLNVGAAASSSPDPSSTPRTRRMDQTRQRFSRFTFKPVPNSALEGALAARPRRPDDARGSPRRNARSRARGG